jgi:hypothetical protein
VNVGIFAKLKNSTMRSFILFLVSLFSLVVLAEQQYSVYVDKHGVMRRSDTNTEVAYYGTNYTMPFAHSFRAINYLGKNHKEAIDKDVYHIARLGLNAFRLHIWDVEITDSAGNLKENEHLDLLDYLIAQLEKRGISVILTAQTNFGNGYPEKNINTGGYSYKYEKCRMHDTESSVRAQERYVKALMHHKNPYTGKSYPEDKFIIAFEVNNEPCHSGTPEATKKYINRMVKAFRDGGFKKPVLYNVSHNFNDTQAFFDSNEEGTTYQWYPIGLVAGHTRHGNFLPNVDNYNIPFSNVRNFDKKAKIVYEFDPADIMYSYMYPAIVRSFREKGFQWATQFAYDAMDLAWANTDYQTHFMNLAYTPNKAISMKIAAEVMQNVKRGENFGKYPKDTIFGDFHVSSQLNLSEYNSGKKFFYSNNTATTPKSLTDLGEIAGCGSSQVVKYQGSGAYFIDRLNDKSWRLEVMPDVAIVADPFAKPSLSRRVGEIVYKEEPITISLPGLGEHYYYRAIDKGNSREGTVSKGSFDVYPGVYILSEDMNEAKRWTGEENYKNIKVGEYVAPEKREVRNTVVHTPTLNIEKGKPLTISAEVFGSELPDSVVVYPDNVSFWSEHNDTYKMSNIGGYNYQTEIPAEKLQGKFRYNIVVFDKNGERTFPNGIDGTPLTWDYNGSQYYSTEVLAKEAKIVLAEADEKCSDIEAGLIPYGGNYWYHFVNNEPIGLNAINYSMNSSAAPACIYLRKYIADILKDLNLDDKHTVCVRIADVKGVDKLRFAFVTNKGFTYAKEFEVNGENVVKININELAQTSTALLPAPYPAFLSREFKPEINELFKLSDAEQLEISTVTPTEKPVTFNLCGVWIEN